jgi:hypothetical protein
MPTRSEFKIGQSVQINDGVKEESSGIDMTGWHGRIRELDPDNKIMLIAFDSITLRAVPLEYVDQCEEEGLDWTEYYIGYDDVTPAPPRDSEADVKAVANEIAAQAGWAFLGEEGQELTFRTRYAISMLQLSSP